MDCRCGFELVSQMWANPHCIFVYDKMQIPKLQIIILLHWHPIWVLWKVDLVIALFWQISGLVEGASEGIGLGHAFLRHVERTKVFIHVVDVACRR